MFDRIGQSYRDFMRDKRVAVIGGADNFDLNAVIDSYEVIVRINSHLKRQSGPCDVLYHTVTCDPPPDQSLLSAMEDEPLFFFLNIVDTAYEYGEKDRPAWSDFEVLTRKLFPRTEIGHFAQGTWGGRNPYDPSLEWLNDLHKRYDTKLLTGIVAISHILTQTECGELFACGMDLYVEQSGADLSKNRDSHPLRGNVGILVDFMADERVKYDKPLLDSIDRYIARGA